MFAFNLGQAFGFTVMYALLPAIISGLFRRRREPAHGFIRGTWVVVLLLATSTAIYGDGTSLPAILFALAVLGALTAMRYSAWKKSR